MFLLQELAELEYRLFGDSTDLIQAAAFAGLFQVGPAGLAMHDSPRCRLLAR